MARAHAGKRASCTGRSSCSSSVSRAIGFSLAVVSRLPTGADAALSISSGYESFLVDIRKRIVCEEGDVFDKAEERGRAEPCDSVADGPFCRGLPEQLAMPRHRPYTVDSIVPQHLFGRGALPRSGAEVSAKRATDGSQATRVLNEFLVRFYNPREAVVKMSVSEGMLNIAEAALRLGFLPWPRTYSRGLPRGILATWEGSWQLTHGPHLEWNEVVGSSSGSAAPRRTAATVRLNSMLGTIRFSRPVVVRHLLLHPPVDVDGMSRIEVRGRIKGKEQWRHAYEHNPLRGEAYRPACEIGDLLDVYVSDESEYIMGVLLASQRSGVTVQLLDDERSHTYVEWRHVRTLDGHDCTSRVKLNQQPSSQGGDQMLWRDITRRQKAVDEISLTTLGSSGWLLGTFAVSVARPPRALQELETDGPGADHGQDPKDPVLHVVQVYPGPRAVIVEVSRASVLYDADDMLQRGLGVRQKLMQPPTSGQESSGSSGGSGAEDKAGGRLRISTHRSAEGLRQLLMSLAGDSCGERARLPPFITSKQFLTDASRLLSNLSPVKADVKKHSHFESFFSAHLDILTPADAVAATFEHWSQSAEVQAQTQGIFHSGQRWDGSYFCTQGETVLSLKVAEVRHLEGHEIVVAEMSFKLQDAAGKEVQGSYLVTGAIESMGRVLVLDPVQGSWKDKPGNFVMVGLHGVLSRTKQGQPTYAGSVPIFGCDSFELFASSSLSEPDSASTTDGSQNSEDDPGNGDGPVSDEAAVADTERQPPTSTSSDWQCSDGVEPRGRPPAPSWRIALRSLVQSLDEARRRWRILLGQIISQSNQEKKKGPAVAQAVGVQQLKEALEGATKGSGAVLSFEFSTADGEKYVVKIGGQDGA